MAESAQTFFFYLAHWRHRLHRRKFTRGIVADTKFITENYWLRVITIC